MYITKNGPNHQSIVVIIPYFHFLMHITRSKLNSISEILVAVKNQTEDNIDPLAPIVYALAVLCCAPFSCMLVAVG